MKNLKKVEELSVQDIKSIEGGYWVTDIFSAVGKGILSGFGRATYNYTYDNYGYYFPW
ncbi:hypothetical protein [Chryseobacterium potabilaquae]|nr:hypothetical protein [Chryseobacterium potabilaquae]